MILKLIEMSSDVKKEVRGEMDGWVISVVDKDEMMGD
jgi:hypothetical protein